MGGKVEKRWDSGENKKVLPLHSGKKGLLLLPKHNLSLVTQFCSGFPNRSGHVSKLDANVTRSCWACGGEDTETPEHLVWDCESTRNWARTSLGAFSEGQGDWSGGKWWNP